MSTFIFKLWLFVLLEGVEWPIPIAYILASFSSIGLRCFIISNSSCCAVAWLLKLVEGSLSIPTLDKVKA